MTPFTIATDADSNSVLSLPGLTMTISSIHPHCGFLLSSPSHLNLTPCVAALPLLLSVAAFAIRTGHTAVAVTRRAAGDTPVAVTRPAAVCVICSDISLYPPSLSLYPGCCRSLALSSHSNSRLSLFCPQFSVSQLLPKGFQPAVQQVSLTGIHPGRTVSLSTPLALDPMELYTFRLQLV